MGTSTPYLGLYKPDEVGELVNVDTNLNDNYDKIEAAVLAIEARVGTLEGVSGIDTNWVDYAPDIKVSHDGGTATPAISINTAEYRKVGDVIDLDVNITINTDAQYVNGILKLKVPFDPVIGAGPAKGIGYVNNLGAGTFNPRLYVANGMSSIAGIFYVNLSPVAAVSGKVGVDNSGADTSEVEFFDETIFFGSFSYRTTGLPNV